MNLTFFKHKKTAHLIKEFYHISYSDKITPFNTTMIPYGVTGLTFIYSKGQKTSLNNNETILENLVLNGQFYKSYKFIATEPGFSCGLNFEPTALHKLTGLDISKFTNKNLPFNKIDEDLSNKLECIFINHKKCFKKMFQEIESLLLKLPLIENKNTIAVDKAINYIQLKEGMLFVSDLLSIIPFGQKSLETKFKKIIGLTPGKYIRMIRFSELMRKYESDKMDLNDLIIMYDYYDQSHFLKDFNLFLKQNPNNFFKIEHPLLKKYLNN